MDFNDKQQVETWFLSRFGDWSDTWRELFTAEDSYYITRPQYYFPQEQSWNALPNLTMFGDAAHCMPPYAGEGVNMALTGAYELYEALIHKGYTTLQEAIAGFERDMCKRAADVTTETLRQTEVLHREGTLQYLLDFFEKGV